MRPMCVPFALQEHHRDKLFWQIYKKILVVPTLDYAIAYQQACKDRQKNFPTIVCLDGKRVNSSSFSNPDVYMNRDTVVPFIFGSLPAERTREWEAAHRAAEACRHLRAAYEDKLKSQKQEEHTQNKVRKQEGAVNSLRDVLHSIRTASPTARSATPTSESRGHTRKAATDQVTTTTSTKRPRHDEHDDTCWT